MNPKPVKLGNLFSTLNYLHHFLEDRKSRHDLLAIFLFALIKNSEFTPYHEDENTRTSEELIFKHWMQNGPICYFGLFQSNKTPEEVCQLSITNVAGKTIINFRILDGNFSTGFTFQVEKYINNNDVDINERFSNISELKEKIEAEIINPVRNRIKTDYENYKGAFRILKKHQDLIGSKSKKDLLNALMYSLMVNYNFVPYLDEETTEETVFTNWMTNKPNHCRFHLKGLPHCTCELTITETPSISIYNLRILETNNFIKSITLLIDKYVSGDESLEIKARFKAVDELADHFKTSVLKDIRDKLLIGDGVRFDEEKHGVYKILTELCPETMEKIPFLFAALIFAIMIDNQFLKHSEEGYRESERYELPEHWKENDTNFACKFFMKSFDNFLCELVLSVSGDMIIINLQNLHNDVINSKAILMNEYIPYPTAAVPLVKKFENLKKIINIIKVNVIMPTKAELLNIMGYPSGSLSGLSEVNLLKIMLYAGPRATICMLRTCKRIREIAQDRSIWKRFFRLDFPEQYETNKDTPGVNWYIAYQRLAKLRNKDRNRRSPYSARFDQIRLRMNRFGLK